MLKNSYKMLFLLTLIMGTFITINSSSWFSMWMGLEINLLSFIPLMMNKNNLFSSESSLKYFFIQALASSILLFCIIFFSIMNEMKNTKITLSINLIIASSLMMKSGMAPFHFWFPNVMEGMNWINNLILMTWQKISPLIILSFCINMPYFLFIIMISTFIGAMGGLNQTSMRKILAFSSINHLGWMTMNMINNENTWKIYFLLYSFLSFSIIFSLNSFKIFNLNQMYSFKMNNFKQKLLINLPLLSLGGLPPFLGFFPKWISIELMIFFNFYLMTFFMIMFSLITLYFYIRISYSSIIMNYNIMNWNFSWNNIKNKNLMWNNFFIFLSLFGLLLINFLFF